MIVDSEMAGDFSLQNKTRQQIAIYNTIQTLLTLPKEGFSVTII